MTETADPFATETAEQYTDRVAPFFYEERRAAGDPVYECERAAAERIRGEVVARILLEGPEAYNPGRTADNLISAALKEVVAADSLIERLREAVRVSPTGTLDEEHPGALSTETVLKKMAAAALLAEKGHAAEAEAARVAIMRRAMEAIVWRSNEAPTRQMALAVLGR